MTRTLCLALALAVAAAAGCSSDKPSGTKAPPPLDSGADKQDKKGGRFPAPPPK